jgi:hypothetical protein
MHSRTEVMLICYSIMSLSFTMSKLHFRLLSNIYIYKSSDVGIQQVVNS